MMPSVPQNNTPPQWLLEVKDNFVASRDRAQAELTPFRRKAAFITNVSKGLRVGGVVVLAVAALALLILASSPMIVGYSLLLTTVGCCGGMALGIGMMVIGTIIRYNEKSQRCYRNVKDKQNEIKLYRIGTKLIDRFEKEEDLQEAVGAYKELPERYLVSLYCGKWNENRRKKIKQLEDAISKEMGDTLWISRDYFSFCVNQGIRESHLNKIPDAGRKEKCRELLNQLQNVLKDTIQLEA